MTKDELAAYNNWLNSGPVLNAIGSDRGSSGERMLRVIDYLEERG